MVVMREEKVIEVLAYHGTNEDAAISIKGKREFLMGERREDHWLGQGVYFYREDQSQAMLWAVHKIRNKQELHGQKAAVIEVEIKVKRSEFLNLDTRDGMNWFERLTTEINKILKEHKYKLSAKKPEQLRCFYCNQLPENVKLIQRTFPVESFYDKKKLFQNLELHLHGTQLCVRDITVIDQDSIKIVGICQVKHQKKLTPKFD